MKYVVAQARGWSYLENRWLKSKDGSLTENLDDLASAMTFRDRKAAWDQARKLGMNWFAMAYDDARNDIEHCLKARPYEAVRARGLDTVGKTLDEIHATRHA